MSRRSRKQLAIVGGIAIVLGSFALYAASNPVDVGSPGSRFPVLTADFGFRRTQLSRSFNLYLCAPSYLDLTLAECPTSGGDSTVEDSSARASRPEIVSTTVSGELRQVDSDVPITVDGCNLVRRGAQFPSNQVTTVAENRGAADLNLALVANANDPEEVSPGTYCGVVTVARATGADIPVYVLASVGDRGQGPLRLRVFGALLLGALMGATVKWLGDRYAPVAALRRRQRRLVRRFGAWRNQLPERAQYDLAVIDDGVGSFDPDGVDTALTELEQQGDALTRFSSALHELERLMADQNRFTDTDYDPPVGHVLAAEFARIAALRGEKFPWADPDAIAEDADDLRVTARTIVAALDAGDDAAYEAAARPLVGTVAEVQVERIAAAHRDQAARPLAPPLPQPVVVAGAERRSFAQVLLDNSLLITMVVGAIVVAIVGYQTQFTADKTFDAGNGDYLALFAWAFALQVAGVTILEVAGKLVSSTTGTATSGAAR